MSNYILGSIRKIIFESNNSSYKVGLFKVKETNDPDAQIYINKIIGFTGNFNEIDENVDYILYGKMYDHPKYGIQFNAESYEISIPSDTDSLILYLSSGMFKGIGSKTAKKIVEMFGSDTVDIIKNNYELLSNVSGMTMKKALMMHEKLIDNEVNQDLILKLNGYGFSTKEAINLTTIYGYDLINIIENDIYELSEYVSFDKIDLIFLKNNDELSSNRIKALIKHNISLMCYETGDTLVYKEELFIKMKRCFKSNFTSDIFIAHLNELISESEIIEVDDFICLYEFYDTENNILGRIRNINNIKDQVNEEKLSEFIKSYEKRNKIVFNKEQIEAIKGAIKNNFFIITGGPGTGKTTIIKAIVELLESVKKNLNWEDKITLLAPTGRAAKRMMEAVNFPASTIHRFLKWNKDNNTFGVNEYNKVKTEIVIIDEASMVDTYLMDSLLRGLYYDTKIILVGDFNQLPSVGPGEILKDLILSNKFKVIELNELYRQKENSNIITFAYNINNGIYDNSIYNISDDLTYISADSYNLYEKFSELCFAYKDYNYNDLIILAPMYKTVNGIDNLNEIARSIFNPKNNQNEIVIGDTKYLEGDKVIELVNMPDDSIYNGDIGIIESIDREKGEIYIDFDGNLVKYNKSNFMNFRLGYVTSIHKSQGSEYKVVIIIMLNEYSRMLYRKLLYTGVTRAKKNLYILGEESAIRKAINSNEIHKRCTTLLDMVNKMYEEVSIN